MTSLSHLASITSRLGISYYHSNSQVVQSSTPNSLKSSNNNKAYTYLHQILNVQQNRFILISDFQTVGY